MKNLCVLPATECSIHNAYIIRYSKVSEVFKGYLCCKTSFCNKVALDVQLFLFEEEKLNSPDI